MKSYAVSCSVHLPACPGDSPIEQQFAARWALALRDCGYGADLYPRSQVQIGPYRVDFLIGDVVVECDGHEYHSTRQARRKDAERDRYLAGVGYRVMRLTGSEINDPALLQTLVFEVWRAVDRVDQALGSSSFDTLELLRIAESAHARRCNAALAQDDA